MKYLLSLLLILGMCFAVISCKSTVDSSPETKTEKTINQTEKTTAQSDRAYTAMYFCQMYCEGSGDDKPGTCPGCGMDYQLNVAALGGPVPGVDNYNYNGHAHVPHDHDGDGKPDH